MLALEQKDQDEKVRKLKYRPKHDKEISKKQVISQTQVPHHTANYRDPGQTGDKEPKSFLHSLQKKNTD